MSSSSTHSSQRPILPRASTAPDLSSRLGTSSPYRKTSSTQQLPVEHDSLSVTSVHDRWIEGLKQYSHFHLHAALSTFKRLLRELRSSDDELPSPTTSSIPYTDAPPYRILLPEEAASLYTNIALIHGYLGAYYLAAAAFEEALLIDEASGIAWFGLGVARFYLRELGASKRAFGKCQGCFVVRDDHGNKHQKEELIYKIWTDEPQAADKPTNPDNIHTHAHGSSQWHEFRNILCRGFPDGVWKLEKARVEWNWRIALFERNYVRRGIERPGGGKWGLNGIPAGVIFGPDLQVGSGSSTTQSLTDITTSAKPTGLAITTSTAVRGNVKERGASIVKQKWSILQHKILRKKTHTAVPPPLVKQSTRSESLASSQYSTDGSLSVTDNHAHGIISLGHANDDHSEVLREPMPSTPPWTPYGIRNPYDDGWVEEGEKQSQISPQTRYVHTPIPCLFPPRRSSFSFSSTSVSKGRRRSSRGSLLAVNAAIHNIEPIDEEPSEGERRESSAPLCAPHDQIDRGTEEEGSPVSARSSDISPKSMAPRKYTDDIMLPNLMLDLLPAPSPALAPVQLPRLATVPPLLPNSASSSLYGSDSFMTDNISPLSSQMRSAMFPRFPERSSVSGRRPSYATDVWTADDDDDDDDDNAAAAEPAQDEEQKEGRRPSTIVTLTPATPERAGERSPVTATMLDDLMDSYFSPLEPGMPHSPYLEDGNLAVVEPLSISKKERMSVTGRTCLGEWEWEEEYERWRGEEGESAGDDDDDDDDEEEDNGAVGEMLLPKRFEGFGTRSLGR
ncbi:MAG: hypothetical protein L6R39_002437 [Caloplaca ligustica]|nr:MAG: hypothetical protein L6R39_002437 [Caloplaca ligustica]